MCENSHNRLYVTVNPHFSQGPLPCLVKAVAEKLLTQTLCEPPFQARVAMLLLCFGKRGVTLFNNLQGLIGIMCNEIVSKVFLLKYCFKQISCLTFEPTQSSNQILCNMWNNFWVQLLGQIFTNELILICNLLAYPWTI